MKWMKGAKEGIVVAGGQGPGSSSIQLFGPHGVVVDHFGHVFVVDAYNHRITRWPKGSKEGQIIAGTNEGGSQSNQFNVPMDLSFDRQGNLYVVDFGNHRIQKFEIDLN
jgi:DNA-binding beta-propeller fold protein YncE